MATMGDYVLTHLGHIKKTEKDISQIYIKKDKNVCIRHDTKDGPIPWACLDFPYNEYDLYTCVSGFVSYRDKTWSEFCADSDYGYIALEYSVFPTLASDAD